MKSAIMSTKKISLISDYNYFDLLPIKKYQQCCTQIPQTILLQNGFIKDWIFNSNKIANHPILRKKRQNLIPLAVVKCFCAKNGYEQLTKYCNNIRNIQQIINKQVKQSKQFDDIEEKKVIQIATTTNQILSMSLVDFLDYIVQNKSHQSQFNDKWRIIQQKVSFNKINEYYKVQSKRKNSVIHSKSQKIISINTAQAKIHSTQFQYGPFEKSSPSKRFVIAETKNLQGYKFFDTFLNKKFFQICQLIIQCLQKNLKCTVQSMQTKFAVDKQRQPFLVQIFTLQVKPAQKITDMQQFQIPLEKGFIKVNQYIECLQKYVQSNVDKYQNYNINSSKADKKCICKGKMCKITVQNDDLPPLTVQKLKLATCSPQTRVVSAQIRDAVIQRKIQIIDKFKQNKVINVSFNLNQLLQNQQSQGDDEDLQFMQSKKSKSKLIKICSNCYEFYFHVLRFYQLDNFGNIVYKKVHFTQKQQSNNSLNKFNVLTKQKKQQSTSPVKKIKQSQQNQINDNKEFKKQHQITNQQSIKKILNRQQLTQIKKQSKNTKSSSKFLSPIKKQKISLNSLSKNSKSQKQLLNDVKSKIKLNPISQNKKSIVQMGLSTNRKQAKILTLTRLSQPIRVEDMVISKTMSSNMLTIKQRKPKNYQEANQQLLAKLSGLKSQSKQQFVNQAKDYYKNNLPPPIQRRAFSSYYEPYLYEFASITPIEIHPKRRIKKRPEMSLKRLSQITDYPQIVSKSLFIFDVIIINEQTTIPFCVLTTKIVNPNNIKSGHPYENIFIINDIFDSFIEHISISKQLLEQENIYNKRIILFNYPGQSHTIYNKLNNQSFSAYFCQIMDKLIFRLSSQKNQLKIIDLEKDLFKFCGFGYGGVLLSHYIGSYSSTFSDRVVSVMLINSFMKFPISYKQVLQGLLKLFKSNDETIEQKHHIQYNKAIGSSQVSEAHMQHKAGLNPIRLQDRIYLLQSVLKQVEQSKTEGHQIEPSYFEDQNSYQVSVIYGKNNFVVPKQSSLQYIHRRDINNGNIQSSKKEISQRVFIQIEGGHDILADNYENMFRILALFLRK